MSGDRAELLLSGLFLELRQRGLPLTVRDLEEALESLRAGYGLHQPDRLLWLCKTLWARNEEEVRAIEVWFRDFPRVTEEQVRKLGLAPKERRSGRKARGDRETETEETDSSLTQAPAMTFRPAAEPSGVGLPRAIVAPSGTEPFILTPKPVVSLRSLIIAWRRFRTAMHSGPKIIPDIPATVAAQCRQGRIVEPVMIPERRNHARMTVLFDISPSMTPWHDFGSILAESLAESRLGMHALYWFSNVPVGILYRRQGLNDAVALEEALSDHASSTLMVVSDAGAARASRSMERVEETAEFLARVKTTWNPIVWMNPMPRSRWQGNTAGRIAQMRDVAMLELTEDGLIQGIDILRGARAA